MNVRWSLIVSACLLAAGCTSVPRAEVATKSARIYICHGYTCIYKSRLDLNAADFARFSEIMAEGKSSPKAERAAIKKAVQHFETRAGQVTGVRDNPQSKFGRSGRRGQMDCIDESTNTTALLNYLARRGLLKHHTVGSVASRGLFFDGRYPHSTAVVLDPNGTKWAVDSWYASMGGAPDILPLRDWMPRGVFESGALDEES